MEITRTVKTIKKIVEITMNRQYSQNDRNPEFLVIFQLNVRKIK